MKTINRLIVLILCLWPMSGLMATDIDIDTTVPTGASAATPTDPVITPAVVPTSAPQSTPETSVQPATSSKSIETEPTVVPSTTPMEAEGILKMKDVYKAGLAYYKKQDFASAIRYLKQSLQIHDPYTPKFYYAEANAMLGVIYEFNIIDKKMSYEYYQEALRIDPSTAAAKKHIKEVTDNADLQ